MAGCDYGHPGSLRGRFISAGAAGSARYSRASCAGDDPEPAGKPAGGNARFLRTARRALLCGGDAGDIAAAGDDCVRSEEHTSELQSLMRISYAVFCLQNKNTTTSVLN